jgi:hypothetical protein
MIPVPCTYIATTAHWRSAPYSDIRLARAVAEARVQAGYSTVGIMLLADGSEYLVEQVHADPCHKVTYYAVTKSCVGVRENSFEGPTLTGATAWAGRKIQRSRVLQVEVYLRVAGKNHLIDVFQRD